MPPSKLARSLADARRVIGPTRTQVEAAEKSLPPLKVGLYRGDKLVKVIEQTDPRGYFCLSFNSMASDALCDLVAKPITEGGAE
jgi:hypothetical protein